MPGSLLDLDELVLRVRSPAAREDITEAVACYKAGAYRAAVVATWTAVLYDIFSKIREIELTGDRAAAQFLNELTEIRERNDIDRSLRVERAVLETARDRFELLTHQEFEDLARLQVDRHRCAHPTMGSADEPYQPAAELVRYHLRSAIEHLLMRPPVQGKAALDRVRTEIQSPLFPKSLEGALRVLRAGPLQRPKDVLVRNVVVATVKAVTSGPLYGDVDFFDRASAALLAIEEMHPDAVLRAYAREFPRIASNVPDSNVVGILRFCAKIPSAWDYLSEDVVAKLEGLISTIDPTESPELFLLARQWAELAETAELRLASFGRAELIALVNSDRSRASATPSVIARGLTLLNESRSWDSTNTLISGALLPLVNAFGESELRAILEAVAANFEVRGAFATPTLLAAIRDHGRVPAPSFRRLIEEHELLEVYTDLLPEEESTVNTSGQWVAVPVSPDRGHEAVQITAFILGMRVLHRRFGAGTVTELLGDGTDTKVTVDFDDPNTGRKRLVAVYAGLRPAS